MKMKTSFRQATECFGTSYLLCNSIVGVDEDFALRVVKEMGDEEVMQYFLSDASWSDVQYMRNRYGLKFAYSSKLGLWVLLVPFYGISWDLVEVDELW